jgi:hypothetical protein
MASVKSQPGSLRAERAAVTRRRIAEAARGLFATRGYGATTLRQVAVAAGVAVQTVYAVFGSKANILREQQVCSGSAADAGFQAAWQEPARGARTCSHVPSGSAGKPVDIVAIHSEAASTDPTIRGEV